jgi:hypothetical protein
VKELKALGAPAFGFPITSGMENYLLPLLAAFDVHAP